MTTFLRWLFAASGAAFLILWAALAVGSDDE